MNEAIRYRMNPWLVAMLVASIVLLATALVLVAQQSGWLHVIGGTLQGPQPMAPYGCSGASGPC